MTQFPHLSAHMENEIMFAKVLILCLTYKKQLINVSYYYEFYTIHLPFASLKALLVSLLCSTKGENETGVPLGILDGLHLRDWTALALAYKPGKDFSSVFSEVTHDNPSH